MLSFKRSYLAFLMCFLLAGTVWAVPQQGFAQGNDGSAPQYSQAQLEQMVAPIAAYPDSLLSQILMAATYPLEVVQAARWAKNNHMLKGDQLQAALDQQSWDPSVKSLVYFPDVLKRMNENLDWTQDLGNAFLAQQSDVMAAVQGLRRKAMESGNLKTTQQQKVVVQKDIIEVVPADPQVIYVPAYDPMVFYGPTWSYPTYAYPAMMVPPPGYVATASLLSFGAGVAVGACMFGGFNWGGGGVYVNNTVINNFYHGPYGPYGPHGPYGPYGPHGPYGPYGPGPHPPGPPGPHPPGPPGPHPPGPLPQGKGGTPSGTQAWQHDPGHRGSVPYRDSNTAQHYGQAYRPTQGAGQGMTSGARDFQGSGMGRTGQPSSLSGGGQDFRGFDKPTGSQRPSDSFSREGQQRFSPSSSFSHSEGRMGGFEEPKTAFHGFDSGHSERSFSSRGGFSRGGFGGGGGHRR